MQEHDLGIASGEDVNIAAGRSLVGVIAARGKVEIQAQSDHLEATARRDVDVTSSEEKIDFAAAEEILLTSGGAYVRIRGGDIELHAPGRVNVKGATKNFGGPTRLHYPLDGLPREPLCYACLLDAAEKGATFLRR